MHLVRTTLIAVCLSTLVACAFGRTTLDGNTNETPLVGEALAERQLEMRRALRDMSHFQGTLQALITRRDSRGFSLFDDFLDGYMAQHLEKMLGSEWPSKHPELMALDASLRFQVADALMLMRYPGRVQWEIREIQRRFQGRRHLVVEYPAGHSTTLEKALEAVKERVWRG